MNEEEALSRLIELAKRKNDIQYQINQLKLDLAAYLGHGEHIVSGHKVIVDLVNGSPVLRCWY